MKPFTDEQYRQLLENGLPENRMKDHVPVALLRLAVLPSYWLVTYITPEDPDEVFGLCDLGFGHPELTKVDIDLLLNFRSLTNVEHFEARYPLSVYAEAANEICAMVLTENVLEQYFRSKTPKLAL